MAALTERIELGTSILILPQRNPLELAKQAASLDVLSGGRLLLGVAAGFLEPELNAARAPTNTSTRCVNCGRSPNPDYTVSS